MTKKRVRLIAIGICVFALLAIFTEHPFQGPVIYSIDKDHGVHITDLFVLALTAAVLAWCWWTNRRMGRQVDSRVSRR